MGFFFLHTNKVTVLNNHINKSLLLSCFAIFSVHPLDLLHNGPDELLGVLPGGEVQSVVVVEGGVARDEGEAGTQDPEHQASGAGKQEEGDGAQADTHVLLGQAHLMTCNGEFALGVLEAGDVGGAPGGREDDDEERGGDQAVEDQHQEHHHVVGLEVVNILVQALGQPTCTRGNLEVVGVEECPKRPNVGLPPAKPLLDGGLGHADLNGETHLSSKQRLGALACAALGSFAVNFTAQLNIYLRLFRFI